MLSPTELKSNFAVFDVLGMPCTLAEMFYI